MKSLAITQIPENAKRVMLALGKDKAFLAGGCVRDFIMWNEPKDFDIATEFTPEEVRSKLEPLGWKVVSTGEQHGTVTVVVDEDAYEVTTFREDLETDGRRAVVGFVRDINTDAKRRDFTMNALYMDADQNVIEVVPNSLKDVWKRQLRFVGDPNARIQEDYLRMMRYFRFHALYSNNYSDNTYELKAIEDNVEGIEGISKERIWSELIKILNAPDPYISVLQMQDVGLLRRVLPNAQVHKFCNLRKLDRRVKMETMWPMRLLALTEIIPDYPFSRKEGNLLSDALKTLNRLRSGETIYRSAYEFDPVSTTTGAVLFAHDGGYVSDPALSRSYYDFCAVIHNKVFPVTGQDLLDKGWSPGPKVGAALEKMRNAWVADKFKPTKDMLLELV